ncbi:MAG: chemotaxis protein CheW [Cyanobacteria bacterium P01_F01_bin.86]
MAILSPLKSRRLRSHKGETTQQVIVFQIQREWFALPIFTVKKVVPQSNTQGDYQASGTGLTVYEGKELLVLDIARQVFGSNRDRELSPNPSSVTPPPSSVPPTLATAAPTPPPEPSANAKQGYLLIIRDHQEELIGLPIESTPTVRRVPQSAMVPLPASYAARVNIQYVSGLIVQSHDQPILFFLNPDQMFRAQPLLPPSSAK